MNRLVNFRSVQPTLNRQYSIGANKYTFPNSFKSPESPAAKRSPLAWARRTRSNVIMGSPNN
jgi:hypothetical protein